jgi:hypothetical protein
VTCTFSIALCPPLDRRQSAARRLAQRGGRFHAPAIKADEAKAAATRVLELHPGFRYRRQFSGVDCAPELAAALGEMLESAGLPE